MRFVPKDAMVLLCVEKLLYSVVSIIYGTGGGLFVEKE